MRTTNRIINMMAAIAGGVYLYYFVTFMGVVPLAIFVAIIACIFCKSK